VNEVRSGTEFDDETAQEDWELVTDYWTVGDLSRLLFEFSPQVHLFSDAMSNLRAFSTDLAKPPLQLLG
jgi:hypothetical protein